LGEPLREFRAPGNYVCSKAAGWHGFREDVSLGRVAAHANDRHQIFDLLDALSANAAANAMRQINDSLTHRIL
jgi:hypothetical protein